ncbi:MAG: class I SAM-dependent methyltransferase [Hydrococcus sp. Prado102]|jgi:SAM-dependent methyltransferase|nr:class I SAM-dependent methyltransferase [Hydrococcus sp. Prado102]
MILAADTTPFWLRKLKVTLWSIDLYSKGNLPLFSDSRYILESQVFPYFCDRSEYHKILFVGCAWFTRYYEREYFFYKDYWTIDNNPSRKKYGAKQHIVDTLSNLNRHFGQNYFDAIVCSGVFGWGLNDKEDVETAFAQCFQCLRYDGMFILGWNDIPQRKPFPLESCESLKQFKPYIFEPLSASQYLTASRRRLTFNFYVKSRSQVRLNNLN